MKKRLFADIETSYDIARTWRIGYNLNLTPDNIIREREIICVAWMWEGDSLVYSDRWDNTPLCSKKSRDKNLLKRFAKVYAQADEVVFHNGLRFDERWLRTRALINGLKPFPKIKIHDTLRSCKGAFNFQSNKLDYVSKVLGGLGKTGMGYQEWIDVIEHGKSTRQMESYCRDDVIILADVYSKIQPHIPVKTPANYIKKPNGKCPVCKSKTTRDGVSRTLGGTYQKLRCSRCRILWKADYHE